MRNPRILVAVFVLGSSIARLYLAHEYYGFQTGDDLEIAEEAFRFALGLEHRAWEIRNRLIPDLLVAPVVAVAHAVGVRDPLLLATLARYPFIVLSAVNVILVFLLGRRWYDDETGVAASGLYAFHWMPLVYGSSLYPRTVAVTCVLLAAILLSETNSVARAALAGALAALAVTARYSEAIFCAALLVSGPSDGQWRRRSLVAFLGSFVLGLCVFVGLYDRLTWGRWFGSLIAFADLVFVRRDAASAVVSQPPWWYAGNVLHWIPLTVLPLFVVAARRTEGRRALAFVALPVVALSAIFHKELRYLQVVVPFVLLIAMRGYVLWRERRLAAVLLVLAFPFGLVRIGVAERRSTNAAAAALWMVDSRSPSVALSQPWAYGGRLFLGNDVEIADLDIPPNLERVRQTSGAAAVVAVYSADVNEALRTACREAGLAETKTFTGHGGRDVTVFHRPSSRDPHNPYTFPSVEHP